jgi:indole-3-acetate monooxygenase
VPTLLPADFLELARAFGPDLEAAREDAENHRRTSPQLMQKLVEAGFLRLKLPVDYGGVELGHAACFRVYEELALADPSVAWVVMIGNEGAAMAGYSPPVLAGEIFGDPATILAFSNFRREGRVATEPGGYRISGRWGYASGSPAATWFGGLLPFPASTPDGPPETHAVFLPDADCTVLDTWDAVGLRGSGSHDFAADEIFVPAVRALPWAQLNPQVRGAIYRGPFPSHLGGMGGINLALARIAVNELIGLATKVPNRGGPPLGNRETVQAIIGRCEALIRAASAFLYGTLEGIDACQQGGEPRGRAKLHPGSGRG